MKNKNVTRSSTKIKVKALSNFSEIDTYFYKLFSSDNDIFRQLEYKGAPLCIALQHNLYDYYKSFIHNDARSMPLSNRILFKLRVLGIDHRIKWITGKLVGPKGPAADGKIVFFAENFVPRILDDFLKVMEEMDPATFVFCTTDYRAYKYMVQKKGDSGYGISLIGFHKRQPNSSLKKQFKADFKNVVEPRLKQEFGKLVTDMSRIISYNLGLLADYYEIFEEWLSKSRPQKIILGSDGFSIARVLCFAAANTGIKTYVLQHGLIDSYNGYLPLVADNIFLWSAYEKKLFEENGISTDRLLTTSSPRFDRINGSGNASSHTVAGRLLFVTSPSTLQDAYGQVDTILEISRMIPSSYSVVIRPHPYYKDAIRAYCNKTAQAQKNISIDDDPFLVSMQKSLLLVFSNISTGIFEAISLKKNFCILFSTEQDKYDLYRFPKLTPGDLTKLLNDAVAHPEELTKLDGLQKALPENGTKSALLIKQYLINSQTA